MKAVATPCPGCPFTRGITPGALGGAAPEAYVGQIVGPFALPCHQHYKDGERPIGMPAIETPQCAGAAQLRQRLVEDGQCYPFKAPIPVQPHTEAVFASIPEFYAHHTGCTLEEAQVKMNDDEVTWLFIDQMNKARRGEKP